MEKNFILEGTAGVGDTGDVVVQCMDVMNIINKYIALVNATVSMSFCTMHIKLFLPTIRVFLFHDNEP